MEKRLAIVAESEEELKKKLQRFVSGEKNIREQTKKSLTKTVSELLRIRNEDIDADAEWNEFGFDSISITEMTNVLNEKLHLELMPTAFFEYPTIRDFSKYLTDHHGNVFAAKPISEAKPAHEKHPAKRRKRYSRFLSVSTLTRKKNPSEPVAVVGMSGIFPMSEDIDEFWKNLVEGKDCITEIPPDRWDWRDICGDPEIENRVKWGGFIEGIDEFDPLFFRISPIEAEMMDPQQRLLLLYVWKALEDAGIPPAELSETSTGVFIAACQREYLSMEPLQAGNLFAATSVSPYMIPNRISHIMNFTGPSEYFDTACSSSIVALHRAIQSIRCGECEHAVVGAINLLLSPAGFMALESAGFLSPNGKVKSFQSDADGYVRSEGIGAVILKPLQKAVEDRNQIYTLIRGSGVCHGGKGMSVTAPNKAGMRASMLQACKASGIDSETVSYIEAHGVGSPIGDAIEIEALKEVYKDSDSSCKAPCISSLKPCVGHLEMASGMAALIKVILGLRSLMAVELRNKLLSTGLNLPIGVVFDHPTIEKLSAYLLDQINSRTDLQNSETGQSSESEQNQKAENFESMLEEACMSPPETPLRFLSWTVRPASMEDVPALSRLEEEEYGWIGGEAVASSDQIAGRIKLLNAGDIPWFWVLERAGEVLGWQVLQPTSVDPSSYGSWAEATDNGRLHATFDPEGRYVYIVAGGISKRVKVKVGLMTLNLLSMLRNSGRDTVFACVAMPGYAEYFRRTGNSPREYLELTDEDGIPLDPFIGLMVSRWPLKPDFRFLENGYPPDLDSLGHGVSTVFHISDFDDAINKICRRISLDRDMIDLENSGSLKI